MAPQISTWVAFLPSFSHHILHYSLALVSQNYNNPLNPGSRPAPQRFGCTDRGHNHRIDLKASLTMGRSRGVHVIDVSARAATAMPPDEIGKKEDFVHKGPERKQVKGRNEISGT
ncbi:MAG: hypothetical protein Q9217_002516 [Psora testacea]